MLRLFKSDGDPVVGLPLTSCLKSILRPISRNVRCPFPMTDYQRGMRGCCRKVMERRLRMVSWVYSAAWQEHQRGSWCPGRPASRPPAGPDWSPSSSSLWPWPHHTGWSAGRIQNLPFSGWDLGRLASTGMKHTLKQMRLSTKNAQPHYTI